IAKRRGRTLVIHDRDAHADVLSILDEEGAPDRVVMHCFSGDFALASECARRGFHMSFAGNVTFKNAESLRGAAGAATAELVLGTGNHPALVTSTGRFLAEHLGHGLEKWCEQLAANTRDAFGDW